MAEEIDFNAIRLGAEGDTPTQAKKKATPTRTTDRAARLQELKQARETRLQEFADIKEKSRPTEDAGPGFVWVYNAPEQRWKRARTLTGVTPAGGAGGGAAAPSAAETAAVTVAQQAAEDRKRKGQSAFEIFRGFLRQYGIEGLAADVEKYKLEGLSDDELLVRLRTESDAYKRRFKANESRIARGLRALSEAEYIELEDQYQNVMRNYGLPPAYYARGEMGRQEGFEKFIAGDVSAAELEDRIQTAQNRVINAAPQVADTLRQFYPDITNGDILAYALDPDQALTNIRRKVTAAEIGAGAAMAGLTTGVARAEELGRYGVTGEQARTGFQTVAQVAPRGGQLAEIYKQTPYTQTTAEQEVFGLAGAVEAQRQRRKLTELETAAFSGTSGAAAGALARDRAGSI